MGGMAVMLAMNGDTSWTGSATIMVVALGGSAVGLLRGIHTVTFDRDAYELHVRTGFGPLRTQQLVPVFRDDPIIIVTCAETMSAGMTAAGSQMTTRDVSRLYMGLTEVPLQINTYTSMTTCRAAAHTLSQATGKPVQFERR